MIMESLYGNTALSELRHHPCNFGFCERKVAHDRGLAAGRPESEPGPECERRLELHLVRLRFVRENVIAQTVNGDLVEAADGYSIEAISLAPPLRSWASGREWSLAG
jgi:hypothetical protein